MTIDLIGEQVSGSTYAVEGTVCIESGGTGKSMRINMVQVLDHWPNSPTYHRNGFKQAATYQDVTLAPGECAVVQRNFTFDGTSMSRTDDIRIIAWAQRPVSYGGGGQGAAYQAAIMPWPFPGPQVDPPARPLADDAYDIDGTVVPCTGDFDCLQGIGFNSQVYCAQAPIDGGGPSVCYVKKNRYISVNPNPNNDGLLTARRVIVATAGGSEVIGWLGAPVETAVSGPETGTQLLARIVDEGSAHYRDWSVDDGGQPWADSTVHVGDCSIMPGRVYTVQAIVDGGDIGNEANYSEALILATVNLSGDVVGANAGSPPDDDRSLKDISAVVRGFQGAQTESKIWLDLQGGTSNPDQPDFSDVNFSDINQAVAGFQGSAYPGPDPCSCVGLPACP